MGEGRKYPKELFIEVYKNVPPPDRSFEIQNNFHGTDEGIALAKAFDNAKERICKQHEVSLKEFNERAVDVPKSASKLTLQKQNEQNNAHARKSEVRLASIKIVKAINDSDESNNLAKGIENHTRSTLHKYRLGYINSFFDFLESENIELV